MVHVVDQVVQNIDQLAVIDEKVDGLFGQAKKTYEWRWWRSASNSQDVDIYDDNDNDKPSVDQRIANVEQQANGQGSFWTWLKERIAGGSNAAALAVDDYVLKKI